MGGRCQLPICFNEVLSVFPCQLRIGPCVCPHALEARCKYSCGTRVCPHALEARRTVCTVHTFWSLGALFALSTCSGGSAQLWRLGALFTAVLEARRIVYIREHVIANALDECSLQFRLFPVPFDDVALECLHCPYVLEAQRIVCSASKWRIQLSTGPGGDSGGYSCILSRACYRKRT